MKKTLRTLALTFSFLLFTFHLHSQWVSIPDANFAAYLRQNYPLCMNGNLMDTTCAAIVGDIDLNVSSSSIADLTGIQYFDNLQTLNANDNQITFIPKLPSSLIGLVILNNQLTSLPALPPGLRTLLCGDNQLTQLPPLPAGLQVIWCGNNHINSLPPLPNGMRDLSCSKNPISSLSTALPDSLRALDISVTLVTSIPPLPVGLASLNCGWCSISSIPSLPPSLIVLICSSCPITSLPVLPNGLVQLWCHSCQLTSLPLLPRGLDYLLCQNNQISSLPELPDSLTYCYINDNPIVCLPQLKKIVNFQFQNINATCLPNYGTVTNSTPSLNTLPLCNLFNQNGCNIFWNISGKTYFDANANCANDSSDYGLINIPVKLWKDTTLIAQVLTPAFGGFSFDVDSFDTYTISVDASNIPFQVTCPANFVDTAIITALNPFATNKDFAIECKTNFDLAAWSIVGRFARGRQSTVLIHAGDLNSFYGTHCAAGISGSVTIKISGPGHYVSPAPGALTPCDVNDSVITYCIPDYGNVNFNEDFNFLFQTEPTAQAGSIICFTVTVSPVTGDDIQINNIQTMCFTVVASCDPNNKEVYPAADIDTAQKWLTYTINFQNTGTDTAYHVYITDTLDGDLDLSTFQLLAYSHQPMVQIKENAVRFNFPNINLVDSHANEPLSHGYVQYKIKIKDGKPIGTQINNTAFIYFDFNAPVVTNTTINTIAVISSIADTRHKTQDFRLFPNPATDIVTISVDENEIGASLCISEITGREILKSVFTIRNPQFDIRNLESGVYFVTVSNGASKAVKKLIINK